MKPTSLSPEFYENLFNEISNYDFKPESEDDNSCTIEVYDCNGFYVCLRATFDINVIDDSFDHAFGREYGSHLEAGELIDIEDVTMYDGDSNDVSAIFDFDAFWRQCA